LSDGEIPASAKVLEAIWHPLSQEVTCVVVMMKICHWMPLPFILSSLSLFLHEFCDGH